MHRKRKNTSPKDALECNKNAHKKQKNAIKKQNKCDQKRSGLCVCILFALFLFFWSIFLHFLCASLRTRNKIAKNTHTKNTQKLPKKNEKLAHKTIEQNITQKRWCVNFGCACACFLFSFELLFYFCFGCFFFFFWLLFFAIRKCISFAFPGHPL